MTSQEGSLHSTYSAIASPTTRPIPISRYFQHKFTDVVSKTRMTCRILRLAQQIKLRACFRLQLHACQRLLRSHQVVFCRTLRFSDGRGRYAEGPERRRRPIGTHGSRTLYPADAWLQLYTSPSSPTRGNLRHAWFVCFGVFVCNWDFRWPSQEQQLWALFV